MIVPRRLVLATNPIREPYRSALAADYELTLDHAMREGVRAILATGPFVADAAIIASFPDLGLICCLGSGYEGIDLDVCRRRNIQVATSAGANAGAAAEFAVGLLLNLARGIGESERLLRAGQWRGERPQRFFDSPGLIGRRIGIVGMGAIGLAIARRLEPFEVEIAYTGTRPKPEVPYDYRPDLADLAAWSDVLILAHRADETNRGMVDAEILTALGPDGFLINVSRGSAVDENALIAALKSGAIGGAALDVHDAEPDVRADVLALPNTVLTPHIAGGSGPAFDLMYERVRLNLDAFFAGDPPPFGVLL